MPACPACGVYYTPTSLRADGTCPHCLQVVDWKRHQAVDAPELPVLAPPGSAHDSTDEDVPPVPWHFKLLLAAAVLYLGFRAWQGVEWIGDLF